MSFSAKSRLKSFKFEFNRFMWKENILSKILFVSWSVLHVCSIFWILVLLLKDLQDTIIWIFSVTNVEIFWNKFRHQSIPITISHIYVRFNYFISCKNFLNFGEKQQKAWNVKGLDLFRFFRLSSQYKFPAIFSIICPFASVLPFSHQKFTPTFFPTSNDLF